MKDTGTWQQSAHGLRPVPQNKIGKIDKLLKFSTNPIIYNLMSFQQEYNEQPIYEIDWLCCIDSDSDVKKQHNMYRRYLWTNSTHPHTTRNGQRILHRWPHTGALGVSGVRASSSQRVWPCDTDNAISATSWSITFEPTTTGRRGKLEFLFPLRKNAHPHARTNLLKSFNSYSANMRLHLAK